MILRIEDPEIALNLAKVIYKRRDPALESIISGSESMVDYFKLHFFTGRWPTYEDYCVLNQKFPSNYLEKQGNRVRVPRLEHLALRTPVEAYLYAKDVIGRRWTEAEHIIAPDLDMETLYYTNVVKSRCKPLEYRIFSYSRFWRDYKGKFGIRRLFHIESQLSGGGEIYRYLLWCKIRIPHLEIKLAECGNNDLIIKYCVHIGVNTRELGLDTRKTHLTSWCGGGKSVPWTAV